ncbi:hypothetical protein R4526_15445 [Acinetobacter baumannii]|nr:hypothetical protein [Acinetobacter baumannii]
METKEYSCLINKNLFKKKTRNKLLPKPKQKYLEAEATLKEELEDLAIGFEQKFQPIHTKHWRFDFHIVRLHLLIEIEGGPWSGGRGGKLANKAWSLDRYDQAEELGYRIERYHPDVVLSGYVINLIKERLARIEDGTDQTISTN